MYWRPLISLFNRLNMSTNVGKVIERVIRNEHVRISELSRKLHVSRRTIYNWFNQESLSIEIICKIGTAIMHDFSHEFPEEFACLDRKIKDRISPKEDNAQLFPATPFDSVEYWMNKYIKLLEKYNELLTQHATTSI